MILRQIRNIIKWKMYRKSWKNKFYNNNTFPSSFFNIEHIEIGKKTYGEINLINESKNSNKLIIGNYCSIAPNVMFILGGNHYTDTITTYPFKALEFSMGKEALSKGDIVVQDDVWIGYGATICSGVTIGQGAIVACGAVITRNVAPYSIVGGVPAKKIKSRFSEKLIDRLINIDIVNLFDHFTINDVEKIYSNDENDILSLIDKYKEFA